MKEFAALFVSPATSIRDVMACVDRGGLGIALMIDGDGRLLTTVTDGDLRRTILAGVALELPARVLLDRRAGHPPVAATQGIGDLEAAELMKRHGVRHLPVLDGQGRVVDFIVEREVQDPALPLRAVVMAGGFGRRLRPLTDAIPKPMLPVGGKPLMEHLVRRLSQQGIKDVCVTTHYRGEVITGHFGDGGAFGVNIQYVQETEPLGTAGALQMVPPSEHPLLVINADILTQVDFGAMLDFHNENAATMTVAVREHRVEVPYGVVRLEGSAITGIDEKPVLTQFINAGIYLVAPEATALLPAGEACDMPGFIDLLIARGMRVAAFPVREYWMDIGQMPDYQRADADVREGKV